MHATLFRAAIAAVMLIAGTTAHAQTADELIQKNIAARGGLDRMKAITTLRHTRTVGTPFAGRPVTSRIVTSDGAWDQGPQGWTARSAEAAAEGRDLDADFDGFLVDYQQKGHRAEYVGLDKVGGKPAHHLKLTLKSGVERHVYLDPGTFLERRHTGLFRLPNNQTVPFIMDFSDWRDVSGVKFAFAMDEDREAMGQTFAIYVESIDVNVPTDASAFVPPPAKQQ